MVNIFTRAHLALQHKRGLIRKMDREQGIKYYSTNTPYAKSDVVKMVKRHIVMPSQATAYKIGMLKLLSYVSVLKSPLVKV